MRSEDIVVEIIRLNVEVRDFWQTGARGWAPPAATGLLSQSRLDWQVSLSHCLTDFIEIRKDAKYEGRLILAWATLGSLVEGTLKVFLTIYYADYRKSANACRDRKNLLQDPGGLSLEKLRTFCRKESILEQDEIDWITKIQQRRNAIHAYENRNIGTHEEFADCLRKYFDFLIGIKGRMPWPDMHE